MVRSSSQAATPVPRLARSAEQERHAATFARAKARLRGMQDVRISCVPKSAKAWCAFGALLDGLQPNPAMACPSLNALPVRSMPPQCCRVCDDRKIVSCLSPVTTVR